MAISQEYLGIRLPYRRDNQNGYYEQTKSSMEHAKTNLTMLLLTAKGERPMMPTYGSDLRALLFSQNTESGSNLELEEAVRSATSTWMPGVSIEDVFIDRISNADKTAEFLDGRRNGRRIGSSSIGDSGVSPYSVDITITFSIRSIPDSLQELEITVEA